ARHRPGTQAAGYPQAHTRGARRHRKDGSARGSAETYRETPARLSAAILLDRHLPCACLRAAAYFEKDLKMRTALCPPKPKELLMATLTGIRRASLGT